ncbi:hypothetical protein DYB32_008620 [Aphanomyces invadans]|uniref:START domain-containing protein n=1 Tax=Aphanomyces invadans TaxID=157072 RepID=A0A3R6ZJT7_9STRA|nr:hypothetical protein DYB32_008620 [Aphanomyces invadans]
MKRDVVGVVVDVNDYRSMQAKAKQAVRELTRFGAGDEELSLFHSDGNTRVYQRMVEGAGFGELTATGTVALSMDALAYALYNASSNDHRTFLALHYGADYLEGKIVNKSLTRTKDPFLWLGAKYKKMYLPGTTLFEPRDATYLEYSATFMDLDGQRHVLLLQCSKDFAAFPAVPEVVRFTFTLMHMFTEVEPGRLEFVSRYYLGDVGKVPNYLVKKMLLHELLLDPHLPQLVQKRRLLDNSLINTNGSAMPIVAKM